MTAKPSTEQWDDAENIAGARFRYRSQGDRDRIVERIAYALLEKSTRARAEVEE